MKKSDLSAERQQRLVPVAGRSGAFALMPPPTPRVLTDLAPTQRIAQVHEQLGRLQERVAHLPRPDLITRTLDRREAVQSGQIEGTRCDLDNLLEYEATQMPGDASPDVVVTLNYVHALQAGLETLRQQVPARIDESMIRALHAKLMQGGTGYRWVPGEYRREQNWIGGPTMYDARFVPPPPDAVPGCMAELADYLAQPHDPESPYEAGIVQRMAIVHAQFETIHPFPDGNGRVGRLLLPLILAAEGYAPLYTAGYLLLHQRDYYDALAQVQLRGEWSDWIELFSLAVYESAKESLVLAERLVTERLRMTAAVASARADSLLHKLPDQLLSHPVISARQLQSQQQVSFPTAKNALDEFARLGLLVTKKLGRETVYLAQPVIDIIR